MSRSAPGAPDLPGSDLVGPRAAVRHPKLTGQVLHLGTVLSPPAWMAARQEPPVAHQSVPG